MLKKILTAVISFICFLIIGVAIIHFDVESSNVLSLVRRDPPSEFCFYLQKGGYPSETRLTDSRIIQEFHNAVKNKTAKRQYTEKPAKDKIVLTMDYGYKGDTISIDTDGRIYISEDAADIRNMSRLHWLWW